MVSCFVKKNSKNYHFNVNYSMLDHLITPTPCIQKMLKMLYHENLASNFIRNQNKKYHLKQRTSESFFSETNKVKVTGLTICSYS